MKKTLLLMGLILNMACNLSVEHAIYEEKLVVFGRLIANAPADRLLYVSLSSSLQSDSLELIQFIKDAEVILSADDTTFQLPYDGQGGYRDQSMNPYFIKPGKTYELSVSWQDYHVTATTTVPDSFSVSSISAEGWSCDDEDLIVDAINLVGIEKSYMSTERGTWIYGLENPDTVYYREGPCYTSSFASVPLFVLTWESDDPAGLMRITSLAYKPGEALAIVDSSLAANIFKGPMEAGQYGLSREPVFTWNSSSPVIPISWLYFNFYGLQIFTIEHTDETFAAYLAGDPMRQNEYLLPNSNIIGGYGLFHSSYAKRFLVYVERPVE